MPSCISPGRKSRNNPDEMAAEKKTESFIKDEMPPMGIYETLYAFKDTFGQFMGTEGTHPWSQGFPLTTQLDKFDGPPLPPSVDVTWEVLLVEFLLKLNSLCI